MNWSFSRGVFTAAIMILVVHTAHSEPTPPAKLPRGTDFANFYTGQLPELKLTSGGNQGGDPGSTLPQPIGVKVGGGLQSAPVTFTVSSGEALLTATDHADEKPVNMLDGRASVPIPGSAGNYNAQVYVHLSAKVGDVSTITATARSGDKTSEVSTTVEVKDPALKPPTNLRTIRATATTLEIEWTPADLKLPTKIEVSHDDGATWAEVGTVPPGTKTTTIYQLTPDQEIQLRVATVGKSEATKTTGAESAAQPK